MALSVPYTLTADHSENFNVSIRLSPDGLTFSGYEPMMKDSFFTETVHFERNVPSIQSVQETFFSNSCLSYTYHHLDVIFVSDKYTLVPDSIFLPDNKELLFSYCLSLEKSEKILVQSLKRLYASLLFSVDNEIYEFLFRSLTNPQFIHFMSPMLLAWQKKSLTTHLKYLYVILRDTAIDLVCYEHGEIQLINSFETKTENDILYFIMCSWKQLNMNQLNDILYLCGERDRCVQIKKSLDTYVNNTYFLPIKLQKYGVSPHQTVDYDVATLVECGL